MDPSQRSLTEGKNTESHYLQAPLFKMFLTGTSTPTLLTPSQAIVDPEAEVTMAELPQSIINMQNSYLNKVLINGKCFV